MSTEHTTLVQSAYKDGTSCVCDEYLIISQWKWPVRKHGTFVKQKNVTFNSSDLSDRKTNLKIALTEIIS